jgi:hypothetical protein
MKKNIYHTVGKVPAFNRKIVEICKFDIPNTQLKSSKWNTTVLISNGDLLQPHLKYTLKFFNNCT